MTNPHPPPLPGGTRLAAKLRAIRAQGGRSVRGFKDDTGLPTSRISRLENAQQPPKPQDLDAWVRGSGLTGKEAAALRAELQELLDGVLTERTLNRRRFPEGQKGSQQAITELVKASQTVRTFQTVLVPALLQTPDYAHTVASKIPRLVENATDVEAGVAARMERAEFVKDTARHFEFILSEGVLNHRRGSPQIMQSQLFHLGSVIGQPHIRFGVIPCDRYSELPDLGPFSLYGDVVVIDHPVGLPRMTGESAKLLHTYMDLLWEEAVEGDGARQLILKAIERVAPR